MYSEEYPSLEKLRHQVQEVFTYFKTSELGDLAAFADDVTVLDLFDKCVFDRKTGSHVHTRVL